MTSRLQVFKGMGGLIAKKVLPTPPTGAFSAYYPNPLNMAEPEMSGEPIAIGDTAEEAAQRALDYLENL